MDFDSVVVGAPVYQHRYPREVVRFIRVHREDLAHIPMTAFFSVSLAATPGTPEAYAESLGPVRDFLDDVAWSPLWIGSFPGALNYLEYNPLLRWIMKGISSKEGGPTDTSKDYYLTRWDEVSEFAADFYNDEAKSRYRAELVPRATRTLNSLMPNFEKRIVQSMTVPATPEEVRSAIETLELEDMPLAGVLAWIRNLGQRVPKYSPHLSSRDAAEAFGSLPIETGQAHELVSGLVGQFWKRNYGIRHLRNVNEFREFGDSDYSKVLTNFWFDDFRDGKAIVRTETRVHSLGTSAERKFGWYWFFVSLGVRLYMRSILHGIRKSLHRKRREHRAVMA